MTRTKAKGPFRRTSLLSLYQELPVSATMSTATAVETAAPTAVETASTTAVEAATT